MHNVDRDSTHTLLVPVENEVFSDIQCKLDISANCNSEAVPETLIAPISSDMQRTPRAE
jgi:hypothetical protein